jgi:hypothetical protein
VIWRYKVTDGVTQLETVFADELERVEATNAAVPFPKFKVNDRVQLKSWDGDKFLDWKAGTILTVYGMMYYDQERRWSYDVGDDISQRSTPEYNLERFENG